VIAWHPGEADVKLDLSALGCIREEMLKLAGRVGRNERAIDVILHGSL
jgi:hypothetical protein